MRNESSDKMNVTSLLNTAAHAAGRLSNDLSGVPVDANIAMYQTQEDRMDMSRTTSDQRLPVRNRTPWTGGGYSLGLTMNVKDSQNSRPFNPESTPVDSSTGSTSPKSPKHKSSDSRSSMSSYTTMSSNNSCHSRSHSRISSLSTVSEYQPLSSYGSESTPTERRLSGHENGLSCPTVVEIQPPSPRREDGPFDGSDNDDAMNSDRARSPSDAILMRNRVGGSASPSDSKLGSFLHPDSPSSMSARTHKRTVSAPDFASLNRPNQYPSFGPMAEPTPPKSPTQGDITQHSLGDEANGTASADQSLQDNGTPPEPEQPTCMFVQPCTTGSTLRKAISHIFGRNKLCTKSIPAHIWVHYCRKHYQRSRYRNANDYALRQVDLVLLQVNKVQGWSDDNIKYNRRGDGVLKHWTLQARKREAKRLQDSETRKRRYTEEDDEDEDGMGSGTAIPSWLQPCLNQNYPTSRMLEIVQEIKDHMNAGDISQIPDIEVLPEIVTDGNESRPKPTTRRASSAGGHRHTKSEIFRTPSMSSYNPRFGSMDNKRMRSGLSPFYPMQNLAHRPGQVMNMNQSYPYGMPANNGFATIAENQADHSYWNGSGGYGTNSVLPQPVPQRGSSLPNQDTTSMQQSFAPQGRPSMHARSMSETPAMRTTGYPPNEFRFPAQGVNNYNGQQQQQQQQQQDMFGNMNMNPQAHQYGYQAPSNQGYYGMTPRPESQDGGYNPYYQQPQEWVASRGQHSRVQSTPTIHQHPGTIPGGPPTMPAVSGPQGMLPSMHSMGGHQQQMYSTGQQGYGDFQQGRF